MVAALGPMERHVAPWTNRRAAPPRLALLVIIAAVGLAAGCAREVAAPTKAEYVARADQVCTDAEEKLDEVQEVCGGDPRGPQRLRRAGSRPVRSP